MYHRLFSCLRRKADTAVILWWLVLLSLVTPAAAYGQFRSSPQRDRQPPQNPIDGRNAYEYLKQICNIGPRVSGTRGMAIQQEMLTKFFTDLGAEVSTQPFDVRHPLTGARVRMGNLIVRWNPQMRDRILICTHYDTRPFPDSDPRNPRGVFIGANDGGSGVALLCELGRHMGTLEIPYGVDFVFFDGEELVYDSDRDPYFLGSTYFAEQYARSDGATRYKCGVLLDMIGDAELQLYMEKNSRKMARKVTDELWQTAKRLGVREFIPRVRHEIRDDHLPLNQIAKIPTCDIIDFDYPRPRARQSYWHTEADTVDKCSAESLAKVGWVVLEWLKSQR